MARTEIPVYALNREDFAPYEQVADPGSGLYFAGNDGYTFLEVENSGTTLWSIGAQIAGNAVDNIAIPNKDLDVDPGSVALFGPFPTRYYSQDNLDVYIDPESSDLLCRAFSTGG